MQALDRHPQRAHQILTLALGDFRRAQQTVLSGHGSTGISTSVDLQRLAESEDSPPLNTVFSAADPFSPEEIGSWQEGSLFSPEDVFSLGTETDSLPEDIFSLPEEAFSMAPSIESEVDPVDLSDEPTDLSDPLDKRDQLDPPDHPPPTLSEAVETLLQELPELPSIQIQSPPDSPRPLKPITSPQGSHSDPTPSVSVRLELARLEQMNNQLGELAILHNHN